MRTAPTKAEFGLTCLFLNSEPASEVAGTSSRQSRSTGREEEEEEEEDLADGDEGDVQLPCTGA